jgi:predicted nuclease of predicted toxin-antitoxin system
MEPGELKIMTNRPSMFLLDENMPRRVLLALRTAGYAATCVHNERLTAQPDTAVFAHARLHHMTIITFDTDYLSQTKFPPPHAGIVVLRFFPRNTSVTEIASAVVKAVTPLAPLDLSDRVYRLSPLGIEEEL